MYKTRVVDPDWFNSDPDMKIKAVNSRSVKQRAYAENRPWFLFGSCPVRKIICEYNWQVTLLNNFMNKKFFFSPNHYLHVCCVYSAEFCVFDFFVIYLNKHLSIFIHYCLVSDVLLNMCQSSFFVWKLHIYIAGLCPYGLPIEIVYTVYREGIVLDYIL
jgi:hypothetical protein